MKQIHITKNECNKKNKTASTTAQNVNTASENNTIHYEMKHV